MACRLLLLLAFGLEAVSGLTTVVVTPGSRFSLDCFVLGGRWFHGSDKRSGTPSVRRLDGRANGRPLVVKEASSKAAGLYKCAPSAGFIVWDYQVVLRQRRLLREKRWTTSCRALNEVEEKIWRERRQYTFVDAPNGNKVNLTCHHSNRSLSESESERYEWFAKRTGSNETKLGLINGSMQVIVDSRTAYYECRFRAISEGIVYRDFYHFGNPQLNVTINCNWDPGIGDGHWFDYSQKKLTLLLPTCQPKSDQQPCTTRDDEVLSVPVCECSNQKDSVYVCALSTHFDKILMDEDCWLVKVIISHTKLLNEAVSPSTYITQGIVVIKGTASANTTNMATDAAISESASESTSTESSALSGAVIGGITAAVFVFVFVVILVAVAFFTNKLSGFPIWNDKSKRLTNPDTMTTNPGYLRTVEVHKITHRPPVLKRRPIIIAGVKLEGASLLQRNKIKLKNTLGEGCFGVVVEGSVEDLQNETGTSQVAIKIAKANDKKSVQELVAEVNVWNRIGEHKNVINLIGICYLNGPLWVVMEFAAGGSLNEFLRAKRFGRKHRRPGEVDPDKDAMSYVPPDDQTVLTALQMFKYALDIGRGMEHLAMKECVHRDLAARNVLVSGQEVLKVSDFGMAKDIHYFNYYRKKTPNPLLPIRWTAPEAMLHKVFTEASDVWSYGVLLWEISTLGSAPYPGVPIEKLYDLLTKQKHRMRKPRTCSHEFYDLMLKSWDIDPDERPKFYELVTIIENAVGRLEDEDEAESSGQSDFDIDDGETSRPIEIQGTNYQLPNQKRRLISQDSGIPLSPLPTPVESNSYVEGNKKLSHSDSGLFSPLLSSHETDFSRTRQPSHQLNTTMTAV